MKHKIQLCIVKYWCSHLEVFYRLLVSCTEGRTEMQYNSARRCTCSRRSLNILAFLLHVFVAERWQLNNFWSSEDCMNVGLRLGVPTCSAAPHVSKPQVGTPSLI